MSDKPPKITDFADKLAELAVTVVEHAQKLPKAQFNMRLDAFKAATAYQSVINRAPETDEGSMIGKMREEMNAGLLVPTDPPSDEPEEPEPDEDQADGRPEDT